MDITILTESDLRSCMTLDLQLVDSIADSFSRMVKNQATLPPILRIDFPENQGEVDVKTAYLHGIPSFAIKVASGFPSNSEKGLPTGSGMMLLISTVTGLPEAVLLDNGYLTFLRTGAAGALAAKYLAPDPLTTVGVIGSGIQARYQIEGLRLVRSFERLLVFGIVPHEVSRYAKEMSERLDVDVVIAPDAETVVRQSEFVVTATPSRRAYLKPEWLHPGLHITAMGADSEEKQELYAEVFAKADRLFCDSREQCFRLGELHHAVEGGSIKLGEQIAELGDLISGKAAGRESSAEITICDLTGVGVQDTAVAVLARDRANAAGLGMVISE